MKCLFFILFFCTCESISDTPAESISILDEDDIWVDSFINWEKENGLWEEKY